MIEQAKIKQLTPCKLGILDEVRMLDFDKTVKSSYAPERLEIWYGFASNLQSIKDGRANVEWVRDFPDWLDELRKTYFPEADSSLICRGTRNDSDTSIEWHRDHGCFENRVVMINFGKAIFYIQTYDDGIIVKHLYDGEVVDFDSKLLHKSSQTSDERYIITFRKVKREFLRHKLF
jgi:hypothetical protein